jgi:hypothetical protein
MFNTNPLRGIDLNPVKKLLLIDKLAQIAYLTFNLNKEIKIKHFFKN